MIIVHGLCLHVSPVCEVTTDYKFKCHYAERLLSNYYYDNYLFQIIRVAPKPKSSVSRGRLASRGPPMK